jgi:branched-chain amino acid transport system ATP-binding protein
LSQSNPSPTQLLKLSGVKKSFGGLVAVNNLSFKVGDKEIVGLIGPNGAGKTTVFNIISGMHRPDSGDITFLGTNIVGKKPHVISRLGIARTFQTVRPFARMTVLENAMMGSLFGKGHTLSVGAARERASKILSFTDLGAKAETLAANLTLAEQRRLELARAIAAQPRLLMLDEVMAGLNLTEISETLDLLFRLNREMQISILVIEHVMKAVMKLCSRIIVIDHGSTIAEGTPQEVVANEEVIIAYMGDKRAGSGELKEN